MEKEARRLLLTAISLIVLLFVGRTVVGALWDDTELRRSVDGLRRSLSRGGEAGRRPERADMAAARDVAQRLRTELDELLPRIHSVRPGDFDVPSDVSPDLRYIEVLRREQDELVKTARYLGKSVPPGLGMPVPNPTGLEDVLAALRALHVVHLVVGAALDSDVRAVDSIRLQAVSRRSGTRGSFLTRHAVDFELSGSPGSLHMLLSALVATETWLALDDVRLDVLDENGQSARLRLSVASVSVDAELLDGLVAGGR